jgi:hypothetical protein
MHEYGEAQIDPHIGFGRDGHNAAVFSSQILAGLRDTLLSKLLSGEIELPEAEELVEGGT